MQNKANFSAMKLEIRTAGFSSQFYCVIELQQSKSLRDSSTQVTSGTTPVLFGSQLLLN